ncbi:hypothetical protein FQA39_LY18014 [Lamprigera yunnana]|nr:hypothetical protein FQA39_LY18014 [Lamprigera yunnana]
MTDESEVEGEHRISPFLKLPFHSYSHFSILCADYECVFLGIVMLVFVLFLYIFLGSCECQTDSPCPNIFQYRFDNFNNLYGYIEVPTPPRSQKIQLDVQFSIGNAISGSNGNIQLTAGRQSTLDDILKGRRIRYNVYFPYWVNIPPKITSIAINGQVLCTGPPIPRHLVRVLTIVNLQHTLTVVLPGNFENLGPTRFENDNEINFSAEKSSTANPIFQQVVPEPTPPTIRPLNDNVCGTTSNTNSLLFGGNSFSRGSHPWLAALFTRTSDGITFSCGSTLISRRHVVTAGHCIQTKRKKFRPEELWVILGRENIERWSNDGAQIVQAESVHVHPDFKFTTSDGDIAVIALGENAIFTPFVRPACLWPNDSNIRTIMQAVGIVVGWGKDENGRNTPEPRQTNFPIVSEEVCLRSNPAFLEITSSRTFCGGYRNNTGPCNGDSGGGFLIEVDGRWTLRGIVSMSLATPDGNCDLKQYVVFSDVAQYRQWILSFINN